MHRNRCTVNRGFAIAEAIEENKNFTPVSTGDIELINCGSLQALAEKKFEETDKDSFNVDRVNEIYQKTIEYQRNPL